MKTDILHPIRSDKTAPNFETPPAHVQPDETIYLREYGRVKLRPIRPNDEARMVHFHSALSEESVYLRYFEHISLDTRTLHERLAKVCLNMADYFGIVAEEPETKNHPARILGVGRLTTTDEPTAASFALLACDKALETDLPRKLLEHLIALARGFGFQRLKGELLVADSDTLKLCRRLGFEAHTLEDGIASVSLPL